MIRSLRRKFIAIAMLSLLGTMVIICAAIGIGNYCAAVSRADKAIALLYQNGGTFLPPESTFDPSAFDFQVTPETPFETRYFVVELTDQREVKSVDLQHIAALDRQTVVERISRIIDTSTERGYIDHYRFGVFQNKDGSSTIIVLDCFLQFQLAYNALWITAIVFIVCAAVVFVLLTVLSKRAIRPYVENLERQRQFITDASHELKTPLAILSANVGLLEDSGENSRWLESARSQIVRLDRLIKNLVELARTEETIDGDTAEEFSVTEIAQAITDTFRPMAEADGKALIAEIVEGIYTKGVPDNFFRLFSILLDNAVKYCDPEGTIRLALSQNGRNICILVSNPCKGVDTTQLSRYFDRFYRADSSRARATGGYGIGLSTAKAITSRHHGRITNRYVNGVITFTVTVPQMN